MSHIVGTVETGQAAGFVSAVRGEFLAAVQRHRFLHLVAFGSLALAIAVGSATGNLPDLGVLSTFASYLGMALLLGGGMMAAYQLGRLAFVEKSASPTRALLASLGGFFGHPERLANSINGLAVVIAFATAFSVLKGAIAILVPFGWDVAFRDLDEVLHFGYLPHDALWSVLDRPWLIFAVNFAYNLWFIVLLVSWFSATIARRDTPLRHQFLMSFMLTWLVGGFFIATGFSSAGPVYFERLGLGGDYRPLTETLRAANEHFSIWALTVQDMLWDGYSGKSTGSVGISAFPSMHVASAVLFALYWRKRAPRTAPLFWAFAAVIMLGSVVLAWHYAVDGYAGALIAWAIWTLVGRSQRREAEAPATPN
jgi:hypothetical protein